MRVSEIFTSIQGESTHAGRPCTFVRATGCDQRCVWCDTAYAFEGGTDRTLEDLFDDVARRGVSLVELTGGEPLLQPDAPAFLAGLCDRGHEVLLETGGSRPIGHVDPRVRRILDLKCPGSGMSDRIFWENLTHLKPGDEVKFVVADRRDYEWARDVTAFHGLTRTVPVLLSPVHDTLPGRDLADWVLADRLPVRVQVQVHKYIWSPETRGV